MVNKLIKNIVFHRVFFFFFFFITVGTCNYVNKCNCLLLV